MEAFELSYIITDEDFKQINKSVMLKYFLMYLGVAVLGLAVGIVATVLRPRIEILVFGIILIVLGAILLVFSVLLVIAPRNFILSALMTSDKTVRNVRFDDGGITISTEAQKDIHLVYGDIVKIKNKKAQLLLFLDKDLVLVVKDNLTSGQMFDELYAYLCAKTGKNVGAATAAQAPEEPKE